MRPTPPIVRLTDAIADLLEGSRPFLTPDEAIRAWCQVSGLVYHGIADYAEPVDCFCLDGGARDSGRALRFVLWAVVESMQRHGIAVSSEINLATLLRAVQP